MKNDNFYSPRKIIVIFVYDFRANNNIVRVVFIVISRIFLEVLVRVRLNNYCVVGRKKSIHEMYIIIR